MSARRLGHGQRATQSLVCSARESATSISTSAMSGSPMMTYGTSSALPSAVAGTKSPKPTGRAKRGETGGARERARVKKCALPGARPRAPRRTRREGDDGEVHRGAEVVPVDEVVRLHRVAQAELRVEQPAEHDPDRREEVGRAAHDVLALAQPARQRAELLAPAVRLSSQHAAGLVGRARCESAEAFSIRVRTRRGCSDSDRTQAL